MKLSFIIATITALLVVSITSALPIHLSEFTDGVKDLAHHIWDAITDNEDVAPSDRHFMTPTLNKTGNFPILLHSIQTRDESSSKDSPSESYDSLVRIVYAAHNAWETATNKVMSARHSPPSADQRTAVKEASDIHSRSHSLNTRENNGQTVNGGPNQDLHLDDEENSTPVPFDPSSVDINASGNPYQQADDTETNGLIIVQNAAELIKNTGSMPVLKHIITKRSRDVQNEEFVDKNPDAQPTPINLESFFKSSPNKDSFLSIHSINSLTNAADPKNLATANSDTPPPESSEFVTDKDPLHFRMHNIIPRDDGVAKRNETVSEENSNPSYESGDTSPSNNENVTATDSINSVYVSKVVDPHGFGDDNESDDIDPTEEQLAAMDLTLDQYWAAVAAIKKIWLTPLRLHSISNRQVEAEDRTDDISDPSGEPADVTPDDSADPDSINDQLDSLGLTEAQYAAAVHFITKFGLPRPTRPHRLSRREEKPRGVNDSELKKILFGISSSLNTTEKTLLDKLYHGRNMHSIIHDLRRREKVKTDRDSDSIDPNTESCHIDPRLGLRELIPDQSTALDAALRKIFSPTLPVVRPSIEQRSEEDPVEEDLDEESPDQEGSGSNLSTDETALRDGLKNALQVSDSKTSASPIMLHTIINRQDGSPGDEHFLTDQDDSDGEAGKIDLEADTVKPNREEDDSNGEIIGSDGMSAQTSVGASKKYCPSVFPLLKHSISGKRNKELPYPRECLDEMYRSSFGLAHGSNKRHTPTSTNDFSNKKYQNDTLDDDSPNNEAPNEEPSSDVEPPSSKENSGAEANGSDPETDQEAWVKAWEEVFSHVPNCATAAPFFIHSLPGRLSGALYDDISEECKQELQSRSMSPEMREDWMEFLKKPYTMNRPMYRRSFNRRTLLKIPRISSPHIDPDSTPQPLRLHPVAQRDETSAREQLSREQVSASASKPVRHFRSGPVVFHKGVTIRDNPFSKVGDFLEEKFKDAGDWVLNTLSGNQESAPPSEDGRIGSPLMIHHLIENRNEVASAGQVHGRETRVANDGSTPWDSIVKQPPEDKPDNLATPLPFRPLTGTRSPDPEVIIDESMPVVNWDSTASQPHPGAILGRPNDGPSSRRHSQIGTRDERYPTDDEQGSEPNSDNQLHIPPLKQFRDHGPVVLPNYHWRRGT